MWDEFDVICCLRTCGCKQFQKHLELAINLKLFQFLNDLNGSYSSIRSNILMREKMLNLNQDYSVLIQEENHRGITENSMVNIVNQPHPPRRNLFCDYYKNKGHNVNRYFKKHGYPPDWKGINSDSQGNPSQANSVIGYMLRILQDNIISMTTVCWIMTPLRLQVVSFLKIYFWIQSRLWLKSYQIYLWG